MPSPIRSRRPLTAAALTVATAAALLSLPSAIAGAASGPKLPDLGDCAGDTPVVVASDSGAQSDIYSAVTLAGALGTDCVVLAGARGADMPADQKRRLAAAASGGYVVGGLAAVPDCKVGGRTMARIAGADRWATAEGVGAEAKRIGNGNPTAGQAIPERACPARDGDTAGAASGLKLPPSKYLGNCSGDTPVVVASDSGAQSDIYSAVTLAGALGTDCVVLAGARGADMASAQKSRLAAAASGGYVVGGLAAVPDCKVGGRSMARLAGADRWATAEAVGAEAVRIGNGSPSTPKIIPERACPAPQPTTTTAPPSSGSATSYRAVSGFGGEGCAIRDDGTLACWSGPFPRDVPEGRFKAVSGFGVGGGCAIRTNGTLACWSYNYLGDLGPRGAPEGRFNTISGNGLGGEGCAIRTNGTLACWSGRNLRDVPEGRFKAVSGLGGEGCAIRTNGALACWNGRNLRDVPEGRFKAVSGRDGTGCAIRESGELTCWHDGNLRDVPEGRFKAIFGVGFSGSGCAIRTDDTLACFGYFWRDDELVLGAGLSPEGRFKAVSGRDGRTGCGVRTDGTLACWQFKADSDKRIRLVPRSTTEDRFKAVSGYRGGGCAIRADDILACWGYNRSRLDGHDLDLDLVPLDAGDRFKAVSGGGGGGCAIRADDGTLACWSYKRGRRSDLVPLGGHKGRFKTISGFGVGGCGIRTDGTLACWYIDREAQWGPRVWGSLVPEGRFKAVSGNGLGGGWNRTSRVGGGCAIRADDGTLACWSYKRDSYGSAVLVPGEVPEGRFKAVSSVDGGGCAIRADDGTLACWGFKADSDFGSVAQRDAPEGRFKAISAGGGIRTDGTLAVWSGRNQRDVPEGRFKAISGWCGIRTNGTLACWG